jgi:hypothetical protein
MSRALIVAGILLVLVGVLWNRIPGNFELRGKNWTVYFPFGACLLISVLGSLLLWLFGRR